MATPWREAIPMRMNPFEFESYFDGDGEETGSLTWSEREWQHYLLENERDIKEFLLLYQKLKNRPHHLDEIAHLLGWDEDDWLVADDFEPEPGDSDSEDKSASDDSEPLATPFTIHKHPVYIVTRGLYRCLAALWSAIVEDVGTLPGAAQFSWQFGRVLHEGEHQALMGIHALDVGEVTLTVHLLKKALVSLNQTLKLVQEVPLSTAQSRRNFQKEGHRLLFDLRELWLRILSDCRS